MALSVFKKKKKKPRQKKNISKEIHKKLIAVFATEENWLARAQKK